MMPRPRNDLIPINMMPSVHMKVRPMNHRNAALAVFMVLSMLACGAAPAACAGPRFVGGVLDLELVPANITLSPADGAARLNDNITISALINNFGNDSATNVTVFFYNSSQLISAVLLNQTATPVMDAGANATVQSFWNTSGLGLETSTVYTIRVVVVNDTQPDNQTDVNLTNNTASVDISFLPDVIPTVVDFTTSADNAVVGDEVSLLATLGNTGIRPAVNEPVTFYLDNSTTPFCTTGVDLPAGSNNVQVPLLWNTSGITDGKHNVTVKARDAAKTSGDITFKYYANPIITAIAASSYSGNVGDKIFINVSLSNNGANPASDVTVDFYLDAGGVALGNRTALEVPTTGLTNLSYLWDTLDVDMGNHTIKAKLRGTLKELRTSNITLDRQLFPDLSIDSVSFPSGDLYVGDIVNISFVIGNHGEGAPKQDVQLQIYVDMNQIDEFNVTPVAANETATIYYEWNTSAASAGKRSLLFWLDPLQLVPDLNDSNNQYKASLNLSGSIDLMVQSITFSYALNQSNSTDNITSGESVWVWVNILNRGSLSMVAGTNLSVFLDAGAAPFHAYTFPTSLGPRANITHYFKWDTNFTDTAVANHSLRAYVDPDGKNTEANKTNNQLTAVLLVRPLIPEADLAVLAVQPAKSSVRSDEILLITARIANLGGKTAFNVTVQFSYQLGLLTQLFAVQVIPFIHGGEHMNITFNWTPAVSEGNYTLIINLDPQNNVRESSKTNNVRSAPLTVLAAIEKRPDVRLLNFNATPASPKAGQTVTVTFTVHNYGDAAASNVMVQLLIDDNTELTYNASNLAPGAEKTVTLTWKAKSGDHTVTLRVKGDNFASFTEQVKTYSIKSTTTQGSPLPMLVIVLVLLVAAILLIAKGASRKVPAQDKEEE
jgi:uncharacterized repeat protein (TIGR01451 family)